MKIISWISGVKSLILHTKEVSFMYFLTIYSPSALAMLAVCMCMLYRTYQESKLRISQSQ